MENRWDQAAKLLAEPIPRRESLQRLVGLIVGGMLAPLGVGTAWGAPPPGRGGGNNACKTKCNQCTKQQRQQCLDACQACNGNTSLMAGSCGNYTCCPTAVCSGACSDLLHDPDCGACGNNCSALGKICCRNYCADLSNDVYNCGACGNQCTANSGEVVTCVSGACVSQCAEGYGRCPDGICTYLGSNENCGACGNVCDESAPYCVNGACTNCWGTICPDGTCTDLNWDNANCGWCGNFCPDGTSCYYGWCEYPYYGGYYDYGYGY